MRTTVSWGALVPGYQVIYADPPWRYGSPAATSPSRRIEAHYPTMSDDEICAMQLPADPNGCALFLWATGPKLPDAFKVMAAWGFEYRANAVWDKVTIGLGFWFRSRHELLLVGTRGIMPHPIPGERVPSIITCKRGEHSLKPSRVREIIEAWYPDAKRLELFARESHAGWDTFGNEVAATLLQGHANRWAHRGDFSIMDTSPSTREPEEPML